MLWVVPGEYNILENGYATLSPFFSIVPTILIVLIPALSMKVFSEEKRLKTLELLLTRPVGPEKIIFSKISAIFAVLLIAFLFTFIYVISIAYYALPLNDIDFGSITGSYIGLLFLTFTFISISVFASSISSNQVISFIIGLLLCAFFYYGFDLLSEMIFSGKTQLWIQSLGIHFHFQSIQRGVIDSRGVIWMLFISGIFFLLTYCVLNRNKKNYLKFVSLFSIVLISFVVLNRFFHFRYDLTAEKRYTLSPQSRKMIEEIGQPLKIQLYLTGDLNAGFIRLKQETLNLLNEFSTIAPGKIEIQVIDPYEKDNNFISDLNNKGIAGIAVNEKKEGGSITQKILFPWIMINYGENSKPVSLLVNQKNKSGEENLNASIENIEYQLISSINSLIRGTIRKIAFIEGHQELPETALADASDFLSHFYQIDRGYLSNDINQLNDYQVIIIAGPQSPFSEKEKFILDQYLMKGGKIVWLVNGAKIQPELLINTGESPSMINDINLNDLFFTYGVRINPVFMQDMQCVEFQHQPFYYAPLLNPSGNHLITKGIMPVKSKFVSTIDFVGNNTFIQKTPLLFGSGHSHIVKVPEMISLHEEYDKSHFSTIKKEITAVLLEGNFESLFTNRTIPEGITANKIITKSLHTQMIVIACEEIIANEISGYGKDTHIWPLGYDQESEIQFGNRDFIVNSINYLTDDTNIMSLRNKKFQLRLLDRQRVRAAGVYPVLVNVILPSILPVFLFGLLWFLRKRRYSKAFKTNQ